MSYRYVAYGLIVDSEIELPDLGNPPQAAAEADLTIRYGELPRWGTKGGGNYNGMRWIDPAHFWFHADGIAHYFVADGDEITVMNERDADMTMVRLYLLGTVFGAMLRQRGMLVLHGNAIRIGDACVICIGDSGAGKSTLAAGFMQRGFDVIADDVVPVDVDGCAIPGAPRIKLWQDAADHIGLSTKGLRRIATHSDKYSLHLKDFDPYLHVPVRWIYLLTPDEVDEVLIEPVRGSARFQILKNNSYRDDYVDNPAMLAEHLNQCSRLADQIYLAKIRRPLNYFLLSTLIDRILGDLCGTPGNE